MPYSKGKVKSYGNNTKKPMASKKKPVAKKMPKKK